MTALLPITAAPLTTTAKVLLETPRGKPRGPKPKSTTVESNRKSNGSLADVEDQRVPKQLRCVLLEHEKHHATTTS